MANFCSKCGTQVQDGLGYCQACGRIAATEMTVSSYASATVENKIAICLKKTWWYAFAAILVGLWAIGETLYFASDYTDLYSFSLCLKGQSQLLINIAILLMIGAAAIMLKKEQTEFQQKCGMNFLQYSIGFVRTYNIFIIIDSIWFVVNESRFYSGGRVWIVLVFPIIAVIALIVCEVYVSWQKKQIGSTKNPAPTNPVSTKPAQNVVSETKPMSARLAALNEGSASELSVWRCRCGSSNALSSLMCRSCGRYK